MIDTVTIDGFTYEKCTPQSQAHRHCRCYYQGGRCCDCPPEERDGE